MTGIFNNIKNNNANDFGYYLCLGATNGSGYLGATPINKSNFTIIQYSVGYTLNMSPTQYDYLGLTGQTIYHVTTQARYFNFTLPNTQATTALTTDWYIPISLYGYKSANWVVFENAIRNNDTQAILDLLEEINEDIGEIKDYIQESPNSQDFSSSDLPTSSGVVDTTSQGLDNYFTSIYNQLTRAPSSLYNITVPIPFTNKSFEIPYNYTANVLNGSAFGWLKNFIGAFWYYLVGRYIVIDLINKFEKIQSGNIENLENENIKEDLL